MEFEGGVAVVTGAGAGLGAALARRVSGAGMRTVVADRALENAEAVAEELRDAGGDAQARFVDAGDEDAIAALARHVEKQLGPCRVLCANVGVQQFGKVEDLAREDWEWVFGVNLFGSVSMVRAFLPQLRQNAPDARILFTASTSALYPSPHMAAYVSSKYALLGMAESLRAELADEGIGVTVLMPGPMATTHLQSSAAAKPEGAKTPVINRASIEVVAQVTTGEMVDADHAARNVLDDLACDRPYALTHDVHREIVEERFDAIREAFVRARR